jgi:hypothetical protein
VNEEFSQIVEGLEHFFFVAPHANDNAGVPQLLEGGEPHED